jgi:hypothetical protein
MRKKAPIHPITKSPLFGNTYHALFGWWRAGFLCRDCGFDTFHREYYMVKRRVWLRAGMLYDHAEGDGCLCIGCVEHRIGRKLKPTDFTDAPVNNPNLTYMSARLFARITGIKVPRGTFA